MSRGAGAVAQFAMNIILGRLMGPSGLGVFYLFTSWTRILGKGASLGLPLATLRSVSGLADGSSRTARRFVLRALALGILASGSVAGVIYVTAPFLVQVLWPGAHEMGPAVLRAAALGGVLFLSLRIVADGLKGCGRPSLALGLEFAGIPSAVTAGALLVHQSGVVGPVVVTTLYLVALAVMLALGLLALLRITTDGVPARTGSAGEGARPQLAYWGQMLLSVAQANAPFVLLPFVAAQDDIGRFGAALRLVSVAATFNIAFASLFAPRFRRAFRMGSMADLRRDIRLSQAAATLTYLPFFLAYVAFGPLVLRLFGDGFEEGAFVLLVLATGQAANALTGSVEHFLNMVGGEGTMLRLNLMSLVVMVGVFLVAGSAVGAAAVAWGYALAITARNVGAWLMVQRFFRTWNPTSAKGV